MDTTGADLPEGTAAVAEEATITDDRQRTSGASDSVDGADAASVIDEGEIAADYIEELLDICDFDGDIDIEVRGGRSYISVDASGEGSLRTLSKPDTVTALQELTRIAVQTKTGEFSRLILDIGGSRQTREAELGAMVDRAVERLEEGAEAASLPPMSSYERKLVHDIVAARGFVSESEGEGRDRHTVIKRG
ncbi:DNA-binding protein [Frigoribacterium sp. CFBP 8766]|nr:DNA-binding protein [Frigoribacterium sp. CFBP 8766]